MVSIERIGSFQQKLGEGPLWDTNLQSLFWVDSLRGQVYRRAPNGETSIWQLPSMIGSLAIADDERALVALADGFHFFGFGDGSLTPIADPESHLPETRFNDGKVDRSGNFVAGTMGIKVRDRALAALYRVRPDLTIETLSDDVIVSNGPCFSTDGSTLYFNDGRRRMLAYDYDADGPLSNPRVFFDGNEHETGSDGVTVDSEGNVWTALTGSSEVGCITPDGKLVERIPMPVRLPSSVMFGGENLDELYVTSISDSGNRTSTEPGAGGLYRIIGLGARGLPEPRFTKN